MPIIAIACIGGDDEDSTVAVTTKPNIHHKKRSELYLGALLFLPFIRGDLNRILLLFAVQ